MITRMPAKAQPKSVELQERRLDRTILRTYRATVDLDELVPNPKQPRLGPKEDDELQRQIVANEGIFEPLLVEPHPDLPDKYLIIDGDRRWTNFRILLSQSQEQNPPVTLEDTDRPPFEEKPLRGLLVY